MLYRDPQSLLTLLDTLHITHNTTSHRPVFTVDEAREVRGSLPGGHSKNLFLRNKKGQMWLLTCEEATRVDLKALGTKLGAGRLSFASASRLEQFLGVTPGSVTPFAIANDRENQVQMVLERRLLSFDPLNFHPLLNSFTTAISSDDLLRFLDHCNHPPTLIEF